MNILINAVSIKEGGSSVVLLRLLDEFVRLRPVDRWYVAVHPSMASTLPVCQSVIALPVDAAARSRMHLRLWYEYGLQKLVRDHKIDLVFSQTNYLPTRALDCPTLLLVQHAGHFSEKFRALMLQEGRSHIGHWIFKATGRWVRKSVATASRVTVQTSALAAAILRDVDVPPAKLVVVPHGPGLVTPGVARQLRGGPAAWRIGYVTKYGVQKNFDVLLRAVALLRERHPVQLTLTLDEQHPAFPRIAARMAALGLAEAVRNRGELDRGDIQAVYDELDVFVFPSLCESFGFPLVEAMARGLPVIAADIPSSREMGGQAIDYFEPQDHHALADAIAHLMTDPQQYARQSARSLKRGREFSWSCSAVQNLTMIDQLLGRTRNQETPESEEGEAIPV